MRDQFWEPSYKVRYVSLRAAPTIHQNHKKWFHSFTKQLILYRSVECIIYHPLLVVVVWLVKMLKIVEKLSGLYGSATIYMYIFILPMYILNVFWEYKLPAIHSSLGPMRLDDVQARHLWLMVRTTPTIPITSFVSIAVWWISNKLKYYYITHDALNVSGCSMLFRPQKPTSPLFDQWPSGLRDEAWYDILGILSRLPSGTY